MQEMDEIYDFVVVGSGGGSMCAGLVMRQACKSVLILEKTDLIGGSTAKAGGVMWIPNNRFMKEEGVADSIEQAETYLNSVVEAREGYAPGTSPERRRTYIEQSNAMVDFLVSRGIKLIRNPYYPDYYNDRPGGNEPGRTVSALLFNLNELGEWREKLRTNPIMTYPAQMTPSFRLPLIKVSWKAKATAARVGAKMVMARLTGKRWGVNGAALQGRMLQAALRGGVELRTHSPVKELILEDNRVIGVVTEKNGKAWRVGSRLGVLLNAGGFAWNQEMRDQYMPDTRAEWTHAAPGDTGDMHKELMRIGAQMAQMDEQVGNQMSLQPGVHEAVGMMIQLSKPHSMLVDQSGQRYQNECTPYMEFGQNMLARNKTVPAVPSWMVLDSQYMRRYMLSGSMPGSKKPQEWYDSGYLKTGKTLEELAEVCGMDPAKLRASVERFNEMARKGADEDFGRGSNAYGRFLGDFTHKPNPALGPLDQGPFYAVQIVPGDVGTYGGAVCDTRARVLREDGSIIEGLYATGTTTAAVMGRTYPGAGCSIGPSFTWGFVAAKDAAGLGNAGI